MRDLLKMIPRPIAVALVVLVVGAFALFMASQFLEMAYTPIAKSHPVSAEDVQAAERKLQLERLNIETEGLLSREMERKKLEAKLSQANVEAHRQSLNLSATSPHEGAAALQSLAEIATKHLSTILAIMFAAILLPSFANTGEPWRLALMISAGITLSGTFALVQGAMSPTTAAVKVDVFSMSISSTSIAVALASIGAVLTGICIYMIHHPSKPSEAVHAYHPGDG